MMNGTMNDTTNEPMNHPSTEDGRLRAVDLFSGVGGLTLAVHEFFKTELYVEFNDFCQSVLRARMKDGTIDEAPIHDDVRDVPDQVLPTQRPHIVVSGWPCTDVSSCGKRQGLEGPKSSLFFSAMKVVAQTQPDYILMENVGAITHTKDVLSRALKTIDEHGYDCRWLMLKVNEVGGLHHRKRWFCLCRRRGTNVELPGNPVEPVTPHEETCDHTCTEHGHGPWNVGEYELDDRGIPVGIQKMVPTQQDFATLRHRVCGNMVVPKQGNTAFRLLAHGWTTDRLDSDAGGWYKNGTFNNPDHVAPVWEGHALPSFGAMTNGKLFQIKPITFVRTIAPKFTLAPRDLNIERLCKPGNEITSPLIAKDKTFDWLPTPRAAGGSSSLSLTERGCRDISTFLRFEERTTDRHFSQMNPLFAEWIMGLPPNYTMPEDDFVKAKSVGGTKRAAGTPREYVSTDHIVTHAWSENEPPEGDHSERLHKLVEDARAKSAKPQLSLDGWELEVRRRKNGNSSGKFDFYYRKGAKKYRSFIKAVDAAVEENA